MFRFPSVLQISDTFPSLALRYPQEHGKQQRLSVWPHLAHYHPLKGGTALGNRFLLRQELQSNFIIEDSSTRTGIFKVSHLGFTGGRQRSLRTSNPCLHEMVTLKIASFLASLPTVVKKSSVASKTPLVTGIMRLTSKALLCFDFSVSSQNCNS